MNDIRARLRLAVVLRAGNRCEYCGLAQEVQEATFHIDHIVPRLKGGLTTLDNLALACVSCSLRKEARRSALDPITGRRVPLFHPRKQQWARHFGWDGVRVVGMTPTGRATVLALELNRLRIQIIRA